MIIRTSAAAVFLTLGLVACGDDKPAKSVEQACTEAGEVFAAAPAPDGPASREEFMAAADPAVRKASFPIRDLAAKSDDWALKELARLLDDFPQVRGFWTVEEVAWRSRATVVRIAELADELDEPACGADTFRLDSWAALTEQLTPPPQDGGIYVEALGALCAETIGGFSLSAEVGVVGDAVNWVSAKRALGDFNFAVGELIPAESQIDRHVDLIAAAQSVDALLPDVASTLSDDRLARVDAGLERMGQALEALEIDC